jgi:hypothetical protein
VAPTLGPALGRPGVEGRLLLGVEDAPELVPGVPPDGPEVGPLGRARGPERLHAGPRVGEDGAGLPLLAGAQAEGLGHAREAALDASLPALGDELVELRRLGVTQDGPHGGAGLLAVGPHRGPVTAGSGGPRLLEEGADLGALGVAQVQLLEERAHPLAPAMAAVAVSGAVAALAGLADAGVLGGRGRDGEGYAEASHGEGEGEGGGAENGLEREHGVGGPFEAGRPGHDSNIGGDVASL